MIDGSVCRWQQHRIEALTLSRTLHAKLRLRRPCMAYDVMRNAAALHRSKMKLMKALGFRKWTKSGYTGSLLQS